MRQFGTSATDVFAETGSVAPQSEPKTLTERGVTGHCVRFDGRLRTIQMHFRHRSGEQLPAKLEGRERFLALCTLEQVPIQGRVLNVA